MAIPQRHPDYVIPKDYYESIGEPNSEGTRFNWFKSRYMQLPTGYAWCHRHPNGGGFVADTANVSLTVEVQPTAFVAGNAVVTGEARLENFACVFGEGMVFGIASLGNGLGLEKIYNKGSVFGAVTTIDSNPSHKECLSISRNDGRMFGELIFTAGGINETGDAFGAYKVFELSPDSDYVDTDFPNPPQGHASLDPIRRLDNLDMTVPIHQLSFWRPFLPLLWRGIFEENIKDGFSPTEAPI